MSAPATSRAGLPGRVIGGELLDRRQSRARPATAATKPRLHWAVVFLLATWVMPFIVYVGQVRLSPYRIALLILFVPCLVWLVQGRAGRMRLPDVLLGLFTLWSIFSLWMVHGISALQPGGILMLETLTPYLIARCCIRNADDFRAIARLLTFMAMALLPFAAYEAISGHNLYLELASRIAPSIDIADKQPRWNLRRAQLFFEHPILMGICLGSILALTHLVVGRETTGSGRWLRTIMVGLTGALSLSSGPLSGILAQSLLLAWNWVFEEVRARWTILISTSLVLALTIQLLAKRPLPNILVSFAFEEQSAYFRIVIWEYGMRSVASHPWFGVGMGQWDRPSWMPPSIDMFWLYNAIVYGIPGALLMLAFFFAAVLSISRVRNLEQRYYDYRAAYLIAMTFFFLTGWMAHFWNGTYVFFVFMVGAGIWLREIPELAAAERRQGQLPSTPGGRRLPVKRLLDHQLEPTHRSPRSRRN